jgi:hypothetical protein
MKTFFYNRTVYSLELPNMTVPQCFIELDDYFDMLFQTSVGLTQEVVILAENLCRRLADVELFAQYISEAQRKSDTFQAAILIGTFLVAYFNACKSLLDAGAITLAKIYSLDLKNKEMDFSKRIFWRQLDEKTGPMVVDRYAPFNSLFSQIVKWRDAAVHRLTPFVITHSPGPLERVPPEKREIKMVDQPDTNISVIVKGANDIRWIAPLHCHMQWHKQLLDFCEQVCLDIRTQALKKPQFPAIDQH